MIYSPRYIKLHENGELTKRIHALDEILAQCRLCPRRCGVNRIQGELGYCKAGSDLMVSSVFPHFGEEAPLVGYHGSGTIFLTHCNLRCVFCQNDDISHRGRGEKTSPSQMANYMMRLQELKCHNINFVTPTHYVPQIVASLSEAIDLGLHLPLVYNCSGYESLEVIKLLDGIMDIYMPDAKYAGEEPAKRFSNAPDYPPVLKEVLREMHRQVGDLHMNKNGIAERGLLIRHLVMPEDLAGTEDLMKFIAEEISRDSYVNIMQQYRPQYKSYDYPELRRPITYGEYLHAVKAAKNFGLHRGF
ncbi:MAG: radical SAM protein [Proteobacteria bacterium]|nr:radical SAM protein [Pseudomonadota bacterium]